MYADVTLGDCGDHNVVIFIAEEMSSMYLYLLAVFWRKRWTM